MFNTFVTALRRAGVPVSLKEHLLLLEALDAGVIEPEVEQFYHLARATLVKDETLLDRFDQVFAQVFKGLGNAAGPAPQSLPEDWLRGVAKAMLSPEDLAKVESLGSWQAIMDTLRERLAEQQGRHQGGNKWIGTGGTSPFGHSGYNPEGVRIGGPASQGRAVKVWEERAFRNLDSTRELGTRAIKLALRRLRRFAREGAATEFDLGGTIDGTARQGWLDIHMRPERHNAIKLLLLLDVGGSMDAHVKLAEELFSAATSEFKHLEFYYFHNCLYESVWRDNRRRWQERTPTATLLNRYGRDWKVVFVGDAAMSPYEVTQKGGSVEHFNEEPGATWLQRVTQHWPACVWLNPTPEEHWPYSHSTTLIRDCLRGQMFPLTLAGLDAAMRELTRRKGVVG